MHHHTLKTSTWKVEWIRKYQFSKGVVWLVLDSSKTNLFLKASQRSALLSLDAQRAPRPKGRGFSKHVDISILFFNDWGINEPIFRH